MLRKTKVRAFRVLRLQCWPAQFTFTHRRTLGYPAGHPLLRLMPARWSNTRLRVYPSSAWSS
ncbi:hypothetical protein HQ394_03320 [Defluviicoccus vanus]|uniref:Uncharacterized protein n=1 Tax=Defluviicoccus vanus TaxID=111831 RepID=A0A7H1MYN9_9PROT|nr:hypothetical protein HQ394_03320 [Defluviicoccus vanus]